MTSDTPESGLPLSDIEPLAPIDPSQDDSDSVATDGETDGDSPLGPVPTVN